MINKYLIDKNSYLTISDEILDSKKLAEIVASIEVFLLKNRVKMVALIFDRNYLIIPTMLACLNCDTTYIPIDSNNPSFRNNIILNDNEIDCIITTKELCAEFKNTNYKVYVIEEIVSVLGNDNVSIINSTEKNDIICNSAYIMYTSGSTGVPKGVKIEHKSLRNFIDSLKTSIPELYNLRFACITNNTFDIFFVESIFPLVIGANIVYADSNACENPRKLSSWILDNDIEVLQITPSRLSQIYYFDNEFHCLRKLKVLLIGGEPVSQNIINELKRFTKCKIYNMYGPTEATIWCSCSEITYKSSVDIGQPFDNIQYYIFKENELLERENEIGELCISGKCLSSGYTDMELDREHYMFFDNKRLYKTGDLVYKNSNQEYVYVCRKDEQIKIRGHRVELGEIENAIDKFKKGLTSSIVLLEKDLNKYIIAFVLCVEKIDIDGLFSYLRDYLPEYMIPYRIFQVEKLPQNKNGKVNKKELIEIAEKMLDYKFYAQNEVLDIINSVTLNNLDIDFCKNNGFKKLNIDSLLIVNLIVSVEEKFGVKIPDEFLTLSNFNSIMDFIDYISSQIAKD